MTRAIAWHCELSEAPCVLWSFLGSCGLALWVWNRGHWGTRILHKNSLFSKWLSTRLNVHWENNLLDSILSVSTQEFFFQSMYLIFVALCGLCLTIFASTFTQFNHSVSWVNFWNYSTAVQQKHVRSPGIRWIVSSYYPSGTKSSLIKAYDNSSIWMKAHK